MTVVNGWRLFAHDIFARRLRALKDEVRRLRAKDPEGYKGHPTTILLARVFHSITVAVPADPDRRDCRLGKTLGKGYAHWRRVKRGLPPRYRLFFRFASRPARIIVYVWLNDEATLRKAGARTDVYSVFQRMLARGDLPDSLDALLAASTTIETDHDG